MATTSTGQNINLAFYQSIEKAIEVGNQLVLDSVLMSDKILTPEQKFELLKLAIEKKDALVFDYISDLKSTDISEEQKYKLIELMKKTFQYEENNRPLLYMIERLKNINEQLDIRTQPNEAMKIISFLNEKNPVKTNPLIFLPGKKGLTQSGTDLKPNRYQASTKTDEESDYYEPNTNQQSNRQSSQSQLIPPSYPAPPLPAQDTNQKQTPVKAGLFTKNPASGKPAKQVNQTRKSNLDGYGAKGSANFNSQQDSVLLRLLPATPNDKRLPINDRDVNIYEEINLSILKKPNEKDSSQVNSNKRVNFDPALKDLTGKILPAKDVPISDNTKGDNQKNNYFNLSPKPYSATNSAPIDKHIEQSKTNKLELLNTVLSTETPVSLQKNTVLSTETPVNPQKNTVSADFKATQDAIKELLQPKQPNNKGTSPSDRPSFVGIISSNNEKQPMPVIPQSHIPTAPSMTAFLGGNQGDTTLSKQQQTISGPNTSSAKAGSQSKLEVTPEKLKLEVTPETLKNALGRLKRPPIKDNLLGK